MQTQAPRGAAWGVRPDGTRLQEIAPQGTRAVVLFFVASDCPISNRTFPEMRRLREVFQDRGVRTWFVYPNRDESTQNILVHQQAFDEGGQVLQDPDGDLVRLSHAIVTPEMVVMVPALHGWNPVYAGRIDNRYEHIGLERPSPTEHYGEEALRAVLRGRAPRAPVGSPVGCAIMNAGTVR